MKNILIILLYLSLFSCNHNIPIANIEFVKIEKDKEIDNYFNLYFSSDIELIDNLQKEHLGARIDCFFKNEKITKNSFENYKGYTLLSVGDLTLESKTSKYNYVISTFFEHKRKDSISNNPYNEKQIVLNKVLKTLNKEPNCISCAVTAVTFMNTTSRYISNTMCLPKDELNKIMNK